jgi:uncharacterized protein YkwD
MRKALVVILLSLTPGMPALTCALLPSAAEAATTPTRNERLVIAAVNHERSVRGLEKVSFRASLTRAARSHACELGRRGRLSHVSANGWTVGQRVRHFGYTTDGCTQWTAGETLARATMGSLAATPQVIVKLWMGSPAHRVVLLTAGLRDIGVGIVVGNDGRRYFTVDLGRRVKG